MKNPIFRGVGESQKNQYIGGNCLKRRRAGTVGRFKEGLGKKEEVVFLREWGVDTPMHTMLRPATLLKKRLRHLCFPVKFADFLRTPFFTEHLW